MAQELDHTNLHRAAKYFMDSGRVESPDEAMALLQKFGLTIHVGDEIVGSANHQIALLTLVNTARRSLLGGIEIVGLPDVMSLTPLAPNRPLIEAVRELGGVPVIRARPGWPSALIGGAAADPATAPCWQLSWDGWRGGVIPSRQNRRLAEAEAMALAPALAAAVCAAEAFAFHAGDHPMAGRRSTGLSLWRPDADWMVVDASEPTLAYLPSRLWIIGLGNLGQAFAWLLACLPYADRSEVQFMLQDFDRIAPSNDSTSLLSFLRDANRKKTRVVGDWLEARGFQTFLEERRFGPWTKKADDEPGAALCGVDNANARVGLEKAGFGLVIEAGLGAGPQAFRSLSMHTFPASRSAEDIWSKQVGQAPEVFENMPAYQAMKRKGMDRCGLTQLASRTVGVPFVGLTAGCLVISELLRRLHGGTATEVLSGSVAAFENIEIVAMQMQPYAFGHVPVA